MQAPALLGFTSKVGGGLFELYALGKKEKEKFNIAYMLGKRRCAMVMLHQELFTIGGKQAVEIALNELVKMLFMQEKYAR